MAKKCKCDCPVCLPAWLAAFGDLMSLLLCFFVLLLSMATMDAKKVSDALGSLSGALSVLEGGMKTEVSRERMQQATPLESSEETAEAVNKIAAVAVESNEIQQESTKDAVITVEEAEDGFMINLPAPLLFKEGSDKVENIDTILFLKRIALIINEMPPGVNVSVQGHTDNLKPSLPYTSNWALSSIRAVSVLKILEKQGLNPKRLSVSGYSSYHPRASNVTKEGRSKNRRVEIHFIGEKQKDKNKAKKNILDSGLSVNE